MNPLYNITKTFKENKKEGPFFSGIVPSRSLPNPNHWYDFCGYKIASRFGVAACPLTVTVRGVELYSRLGFDVITFKTIRSKPSPAHAWPNIVYVNAPAQLGREDLVHSLQQAYTPGFAIANSIGNASEDLETSLAAIATARSLLLAGQILIVSIYGTGSNQEELTQDFLLLAHKAQEAGAHIIEANLSCPNIRHHGELYMDYQLVYAITKAIVKVISIPLLIKVGLMPNKNTMHAVLGAAARAGGRGITGINAVGMKVVNERNEPVFGKSRLYSGVSGAPIRNLALSFLQDAITINDQEKLGLTFIGVGGVVQPEHITQFLDAGAQVVQTATGAIWNPYLAIKYHQRKRMKYIIIVFSLFIFYTEAMENDVENKKYDSLKALSALNISGSDLYVAAKNGTEKIIQEFLKTGGDPNEEFVTSMNNSLLHYSALFNHEKNLQLLISYGARVNIKNWCGETPLNRAIGSENKNMIIMLHRAGARHDIVNIWNNTPGEIAKCIDPELGQLVEVLEKEIPTLKLLCMRYIVKNKLDASKCNLELQRAIDCIREDE